MKPGMSLAGKRAVVTGGGRGIGEAVARRLAADGADVVVTGRTKAEIEAVASAIGGTASRVDLADRDAADAFAAEVGDVDILINNAGIAVSAPLAKIDDETWDKIMEVNATAPFRLCRALVPGMVERGWGRVINIASNAGISGYQYSTAYCASKHALVGMTRALAIDLGRTGVTINAICPGWVETKMATDAVDRIAGKTGRSAADARKALERMSPQNRMIQPEEVAHAVASLIPDEARGIHGQAIVIDGGAVLK